MTLLEKLAKCSHTSFQEKIEKLKAGVKAQGYPIDDSKVTLEFCIVGFPRDEEVLQAASDGLNGDMRAQHLMMSSSTRGKGAPGTHSRSSTSSLRYLLLLHPEISRSSHPELKGICLISFCLSNVCLSSDSSSPLGWILKERWLESPSEVALAIVV
ncbi:unnamed protein product [Phytophthora lilii]|uniref:Unnamed protein product n=1 Tax=Phytophthora lilii TaxID=2077276 RepID=A0A9W6WX90_9STRA|nr:unnamed protein product [Phytophthora lilii]